MPLRPPQGGNLKDFLLKETALGIGFYLVLDVPVFLIVPARGALFTGGFLTAVGLVEEMLMTVGFA